MFMLDDWTAMRKAVESREPVLVKSHQDPDLSSAEIRADGTVRRARHLHRAAHLERTRDRGARAHRPRAAAEPTPQEETATIVSICRFAALAINNAELFEGMKSMHLGNLRALSSALTAKDFYTLGHAARVAAYVVLLGEELGWPDRCCAKSRRPRTCTTSARSVCRTGCCSSRAASPRGVGADAAAPDLQRRDHPAAVR